MKSFVICKPYQNKVYRFNKYFKIRFIPSEGRYDADNEVESTYRILIPSNIQNYHLPRFRPVPETLQLSVQHVFESDRLSIAPIMGQIGVPLDPILQVNII